MKKLITLSCFIFLFTNLFSQRLQIPYFDDFESGAPGWYASDDGQGTAWELGVPTFGFTLSAHSGTKCWDVNLNTGYLNNATCYLYSPVFDFTYVPVSRVSFWVNYHVEYLWDYLSVEYTTDKGYSWSFLPFPELISPDGTSAKWVKSSLMTNNLYGNAEVQFRFTFISDGSVTYDGYSFDDFRIDAEPLAVNDPEASGFSIYPNPSGGSFNVKMNSIPGNEYTLNLYDFAGKLVDSKTGVLPVKEHFSLLSSGIYFLTFQCNDEIWCEKVVVEKKIRDIGH